MIYLLLILLLPQVVFAQLTPGSGIELQDEGASQGRIRTLNCTGSGVACSVVGTVGTIDGSGGGSAAPSTYAYWGSGSDATLSAEINLASLSTGLVLNTAGTPSAYAGATCTNQVIRLLSGSGAATCQTITSAYVDTSIWTGTVASGLLKASSQGVLAQAVSGTDYVTPAGNVATATALAANGGNCSGNNFALGVDASGVGECAQPAFSNLSGSLALSQSSMATARLLGRTTAGTGAFEEITVNSPLTFSAGVLDIASIADSDLASNYSGTGDCGAGSFARTLNDNASPTCAADDDTPDSLSELPSIGTARIMGRVTAGSGVIEELTGTQATTLLDAFTDALKGVAPASGGGTTNFLRADGSWAAPPGGGGAPTDATYWVGAAHASLSAEINLGALGTGLVINTTGTPSIYAGTSCTNQFPRSLNASGSATCADVTASDFGSQTANLVLAAPDGAPGDPTFRALVDADIPDTITLTNLTQITNRAISDTTGTLLVPRGGSGLTTVAANQVYVGTAADTFTAKTLPSCSNGTTDKLLYDNTTQAFSCGTDQGGAGGGLSHDQTMTRVSYGF